MIKIRTVFQPGEEFEVDDAEHEVLRAQGLLHHPPPAVAEPAAAIPAPPPQPGPKPAPATAAQPTEKG
jgi:hypothetical protein